MRSPFVSREAFDAVVSERDRLRAQVDTLLEHRTRMERVQAGRPESPPEARKRPDPMPRCEWIEELDSQWMRADAYERARRLKLEAGPDASWESVFATLEKEYEPT